MGMNSPEDHLDPSGGLINGSKRVMIPYKAVSDVRSKEYCERVMIPYRLRINEI